MVLLALFVAGQPCEGCKVRIGVAWCDDLCDLSMAVRSIKLKGAIADFSCLDGLETLEVSRDDMAML